MARRIRRDDKKNNTNANLKKEKSELSSVINRQKKELDIINKQIKINSKKLNDDIAFVSEFKNKVDIELKKYHELFDKINSLNIVEKDKINSINKLEHDREILEDSINSIKSTLEKARENKNSYLDSIKIDIDNKVAAMEKRCNIEKDRMDNEINRLANTIISLKSCIKKEEAIKDRILNDNNILLIKGSEYKKRLEDLSRNITRELSSYNAKIKMAEMEASAKKKDIEKSIAESLDTLKNADNNKAIMERVISELLEKEAKIKNKIGLLQVEMNSKRDDFKEEIRKTSLELNKLIAERDGEIAKRVAVANASKTNKMLYAHIKKLYDNANIQMPNHSIS